MHDGYVKTMKLAIQASFMRVRGLGPSYDSTCFRGAGRPLASPTATG